MGSRQKTMSLFFALGTVAGLVTSFLNVSIEWDGLALLLSLTVSALVCLWRGWISIGLARWRMAVAGALVPPTHLTIVLAVLLALRIPFSLARRFGLEDRLNFAIYFALPFGLAAAAAMLWLTLLLAGGRARGTVVKFMVWRGAIIIVGGALLDLLIFALASAANYRGIRDLAFVIVFLGLASGVYCASVGRFLHENGSGQEERQRKRR